MLQNCTKTSEAARTLPPLPAVVLVEVVHNRPPDFPVVVVVLCYTTHGVVSRSVDFGGRRVRNWGHFCWNWHANNRPWSDGGRRPRRLYKGHVRACFNLFGGGEKAREQYRPEEGCYKYLCNKDHCLVLWFSSGEATRELAGRLGFLLGEASLPTYPVVSGLLSSDDNRVAATLLCHLPDFGDFNSICAFLHAMWRMRVTR